MPTWVLYSLLSMLFAGLTAVVAKLGLNGISSDLGLAVRTTVVFGLVILNFLCFQNVQEVGQLTSRNVGLLAVSGLATTLSWVFYYKAIQLGRVSDVALIDKGSIVLTILLSVTLLREPVTPKLLIGGGLILAGLIVLIWPR